MTPRRTARNGTMYTDQREDWTTGDKAKRTRIIIRDKPDLRVGGLYVHLGKGYPGCRRVVSMDAKEGENIVR